MSLDYCYCLDLPLGSALVRAFEAIQVQEKLQAQLAVEVETLEEERQALKQIQERLRKVVEGREALDQDLESQTRRFEASGDGVRRLLERYHREAEVLDRLREFRDRLAGIRIRLKINTIR